MPVTVEPELVGTMTGGRPVAVFKSDKSIVMVPQGGAYLGWRILRVGHSEATVWNGGVTLRLRVGSPSTAATRSAEAPPTMPRGYATADMIMVHYGTRPAPTRQDLVYGRVEDPLDYAQEQGPVPTTEPPAVADETALPANPPTRTEGDNTTSGSS
jgi:hypothetical protein